MSVFRRKMNVAAENLANSETTRTSDGGPYKKKTLQVVAQKVPTTFSKTLNKAKVKLAQTSSTHMRGKRIPRYSGTNIFQARASEEVDPDQKVRVVYDPSHPDADEDGFVAMPDIDPLIEMVNMMTAARAFEANVSSLEAIKEMNSKALDI